MIIIIIIIFENFQFDDYLIDKTKQKTHTQESYLQIKMMIMDQTQNTKKLNIFRNKTYTLKQKKAQNPSK